MWDRNPLRFLEMTQLTESKVRFHFITAAPSLKRRKELKAFIVRLFQKEKKKLEDLNYIFCTDEYLLGINRDFLKHDYYTDIITFDLSDGAATKGEIYISVDRVKDNAMQLDQTLSRELQRVIFHGALHLCGYKDKKPADIKQMRAKEDYYITLFNK